MFVKGQPFPWKDLVGLFTKANLSLVSYLLWPCLTASGNFDGTNPRPKQACIQTLAGMAFWVIVPAAHKCSGLLLAAGCAVEYLVLGWSAVDR